MYKSPFTTAVYDINTSIYSYFQNHDVELAVPNPIDEGE
jgi:hypothetical protein